MAQRYVERVARLEDILRRLEPSLGPLSGEPEALSGGITNHNFRARLGGVDYVIRVHGRDTDALGIDRVAERLASDAAATLAIAPALAASEHDCLVTRFVPSDPVSSVEVAENVAEIARAVRSFHDCAVQLPASFWVPDLLDAYAVRVRERGGALPDAYADAVALAARIAAVLPLDRPVPSHNDLLAGNLIRAHASGQMLIVDWEYAGMGHPCFDLGNLSVNNDFDDERDQRLLSAYDREPPSDARRAALKLMRLLSDAREGAWGVMQAHVSELDFDFEGYAGTHFERLRAAAEQPLLEEWLALAGGGAWEQRGGQAP
jgi:thiamine kinase-like enzyme